ncbi:MAG: hypothetical protein SNH01_06320 [Rikenellaceae bacterium]
MTKYTKDGKTYISGWLKVGGRWVSNPTHEQLTADGWVEYVAPTPSEPTPLTAEEQRQQAYLSEQLIEWKDKTLTVDEAKDRWTELMSEGDTNNADTLRDLIAEVKASIREQYN